MPNVRGDVQAIYNASGNLVAEYTYDAWGNVTEIRDSSGAEITDQSNIGHLNRIRYRGYYYDVETGWYYLKSRYYDVEIGRFLNADGYVSTGTGLLGHNMFAYCDNNPVNFADPTGTCITNARGDTIHHGCDYEFRYSDNWHSSVLGSVAQPGNVLYTGICVGTETLKKGYSSMERPANIGKGTFKKYQKQLLQNVDQMNNVVADAFDILELMLMSAEVCQNINQNKMNGYGIDKIVWDATIDMIVLGVNFGITAALAASAAGAAGVAAGLVVGITVGALLETAGDEARRRMKSWAN